MGDAHCSKKARKLQSLAPIVNQYLAKENHWHITCLSSCCSWKITKVVGENGSCGRMGRRLLNKERKFRDCCGMLKLFYLNLDALDGVCQGDTMLIGRRRSGCERKCCR